MEQRNAAVIELFATMRKQAPTAATRAKKCQHAPATGTTVTTTITNSTIVLCASTEGGESLRQIVARLLIEKRASRSKAMKKAGNE